MTLINETLKKTKKFLEIIGIIGNISIIVGVIAFVVNEQQRRNAEIYQAWQVITAAYDQSGSGGRREALEFLNSEPRRFPFFWLKWKRQSLAGLEAPKAYLVKIELQKADLGSANLQYTNLYLANLQYAHLDLVNFSHTFLKEANLQYVLLQKANLQYALLEKANLQQADLREVDFKQADLRGANLQQAILIKTKNLTHKQIKSACFWETAIYKGKWDGKKKQILAAESDNTKFIEDLKKDSSSDQEKSIDCEEFWEKK